LRVLNNTKYGFYKYFKVNSYISKHSDNYSRYILRLYEIYESLNIINKVSQNYKNNYKKNIFLKNYINMEKTINHFKVWSGTLKSKKSFTNSFVESPKGMFGCSIFLKKNSEPFLCKIRSPSYNNLLWIKYKTYGLSLQDLVSMIGTIDIVFGEIDR
jgi:NADH-quinone oxidoreductase subunit D